MRREAGRLDWDRGGWCDPLDTCSSSAPEEGLYFILKELGN